MGASSFPKAFDTYREAYSYWQKHKSSAPAGMVMTISVDGHTINLRKANDDINAQRVERPNSPEAKRFGSDTLPGGVNGIINHADGKRYDSKSNYEKAVRAKGCRIVGNDWNKSEGWKPPIERGLHGDYNVRPALKQAVEKVMGS